MCYSVVYQTGQHMLRFLMHWLLANTNSILPMTSELEYQEVIQRHMGRTVADDLLELLPLLRNVHYIQRYYRFGLIVADPDDNKFVDCAIAAGADYLVTDDRHFIVLAQIPFPKIEMLTAEQFLALVMGGRL
jgi:uncharacterized protein